MGAQVEIHATYNNFQSFLQYLQNNPSILELEGKKDELPENLLFELEPLKNRTATATEKFSMSELLFLILDHHVVSFLNIRYWL